MSNAREKLGSVWTDVAMLLIGDPCRFLQDPNDPPDARRVTYPDLLDLCHGAGDEERRRARADLDEFERLAAGLEADPEGVTGEELLRLRELAGSPPGRAGMANYEARVVPPHKGVAVNVECDGYYPVYLVRNAKGEPVRIEIDLGGQIEP